MIGKEIHHYKILEKLGEGGMGIVYKAWDTKLDRTVALKFLPTHSLGNDDDRKRFETEAKAAAALNHNNIATVYEINDHEGDTFIAMEYVDGDTLEDKIKKAPLKIKDAMKIAKQVADGLAAAHEKEIFHRDIKGSNVMITPKGVVKIMDFGLAKMSSATMVTKAGITLGTVGYMSPEQSKGEVVDHRTDIWSLGVVFYEMIAGVRPFKGEYETALVYSILNVDPEPLTGLRTGVPMDLEKIINKLLAKDPDERYQNIIELPVDLKNVNLKDVGTSQAGTSQIGSSVISQTVSGQKQLQVNVSYSFGTIAKYVAVAVLFFVSAWYLKPGPPPPQVIEAQIGELPPYIFPYNKIAISPDGLRAAYIGIDGLLTIRSLDSTEELKIPDSEDSQHPRFSPDGTEIIYNNHNILFRFPVEGGDPFPIGQFGVGPIFWGDDGFIYKHGREGIYRISSSGVSQKEILVNRDSSSLLLRNPILIPNTRKMVYTRRESSPDLGSGEIMVFDLETKESVSLMQGGSAINVIEEGYLIYFTGVAPDFRRVAVEFDIENLTLGDEHIPILENAVDWEYSPSGNTIYTRGSASTSVNEELVLVDRNGNGQIISDEKNFFSTPSFSPDGKKIAVAVNGLENDIWTIDVETNLLSRITNSGRVDNPIWSLDGSFITYRNSGENNIVHIPIDKSREPEILVDFTGLTFPLEWFSKNGREYLLFQQRATSGITDIWIYSPDADSSFAFLEGSGENVSARASPDGSYIAYRSDVSGEVEIYVRSFPVSGGAVQVTIDGGEEPVWSPKGNELFFRNGNEMWSATFVTGPGFRITGRQKLFEGTYEMMNAFSSYDVHPDGDKFLMVQNNSSGEGTKIMIMTNWLPKLQAMFNQKN